MLDCETPLGKTYINHQIQTQKILESKGYVFLNMATKDSAVDAIIAKSIDGNLTVCGIAEIKSRRMAGDKTLTRSYLRSNGGYLITNDKLTHGSEASFVFEVPFFLIVNLLEERVILIWKVTDERGQFLFDFETRDTATQATCNGGEIVRTNSYLPVDKATVVEY